jgi:hypothetical protein
VTEDKRSQSMSRLTCSSKSNLLIRLSGIPTYSFFL